MPEKLLQDILAELTAIRLLIAAQGQSAPAPARAASPAAQSSTPAADGPPPQPSTLIEDPGSICVHFGKNNGVALGTLGERSLAFYASVKAPRLDSAGKAFPPRPQDVLLENAARQLWHQNKGTLQGQVAAPVRTPPPARPAQKPLDLDEDVPF